MSRTSRSAARGGYDLVIGVGFLMGDALSTVAQQFPDTDFAIVDFPWAALKDKPQNVRGLVFAEQEAGYLVGVAAATVADGGKVSAVGGQAVPAVVAFLAGYRAGVKATDPSMDVLQGYSQDFVDQAKCKELALTQITRGSKAVFAAAGGLRARRAPGREGAKRLGDRRRQRPVIPRTLHPHERDEEGRRRGLRHDPSEIDDKFEGGADSLFDVANGGVGYGKVSADAPDRDALIAKLDDVSKQIADGKIDVPRG